ncbi:aminotransferase class I/II-fold pyridoxal phosphate-dependent enzyme [Bacillaceae bacterium Marseille-Q3522]|nr:aminotransferase class I/II-fold pyridoxal phosphate-dependent enzyme [Bacillaceae bacterium Marseille-Q3522]
MDQTQTPLFDQLQDHRQKSTISLHVPGHKNGALFGHNNLFHDLSQIDLTELSGLDDLHSPEGVIRKAQKLLADAYRVKQSFFLVNGSTAGNMAMILASLKEKDQIFVQRNCHKSILNGIRLAKGNPIFLQPEYNREWKIAGGLSVKTVEKAIALYPNVKVMVLTYPNYYGMIYNIEDIITLAHQHNIAVLVDEAHGAHFIGSGQFPKSTVSMGADAVVQSAHKTLPAMTMGAFLHCNGPNISAGKIADYLAILQSSSPSYPIMASLDIARSYIATYTEADASYLMEQIKGFRELLGKINGIRLLSDDAFNGDPLKVTIQSKSSLSGYELLALLEKQGIFAEMADPSNVLFVLPLLKKGHKFPFYTIIKKMEAALKNINEVQTAGQKDEAPRQETEPVEPVTLAIPIYEQSHLQKGRIPLSKAAGRIAAEQVIPYPPGIPLLFPGERISTAHIDSLQSLLNKQAKLQCHPELYKGFIEVFLASESGENM